MKPSTRTKPVCLIAGLAALALSLLFFSCEPQNWQEYVIAKPEPITDLTVTDVEVNSGSIAISFTYVVPSFSIQTFTDDSK